MDVLILSTQDGDWEGLYVRGQLVTEGHSIDRMELLEASYERFTHRDVRFEELRDEDEDLLAISGSFPFILEDFNHEY